MLLNKVFLDKIFIGGKDVMKKTLMLIGSFIVVISIFTICFGEGKTISIDAVQNVKSIKELRDYLGTDDWSIKMAILEKLYQFKEEKDESEKVEILYLLYMQEETEENNKIEYTGGKGPMHIRIQSEALSRLMSLPEEKIRKIPKKEILYRPRKIPVEKAQKRILDIVEGYLLSVNGMNYQKWRFSPKQALQINIACLLATYIEDNDIREMAHRYIQSKTIKEYAKVYLEIPLLEYELLEYDQKNLQPLKDPKKEEQKFADKIKMVLRVTTKPELREMFYCPKRIYWCGEVLKKVLKNDMTKLDVFMESSELTQPEKYFLYFFVVKHSSEELKKSFKLSDTAINRIEKAVDFWAEIYPTVSVKEKYASDPLNECVSEIAEKVENKDLKKRIGDCKKRAVDLMKKQQ